MDVTVLLQVQSTAISCGVSAKPLCSSAPSFEYALSNLQYTASAKIVQHSGLDVCDSIVALHAVACITRPILAV